MSADPADVIEPSKGMGGLPIAPEALRALEKPSAARSLAMTALWLAAWVGLGLAVAWSPSWWLTVPLLVVAGFCVNGLVQLGHDAWHHNLFAKPWQNHLYGHLFSLPFGVSYSAARHAHLRHHWYNRTERDPDAYNVGARGPAVVFQYYLVIFLGLLLSPLHFNLLYPIAFYERRALPRHFAELLLSGLVYALVFALVPASARGTVAVVWLAPLLAASPWNGLKSVADHFANQWRGDRFHTATTVRTTRLWSWAWNGLNHHLDHHLFPRVPGFRLGAVHAQVRAALDERRAPVFDGYLRVFWAAFRAGPVYVEDGHAFLKSGSRGKP